MNNQNYVQVFIQRHSEIEKDIFQLKKHILKTKKEQDVLRRSEGNSFLVASMTRFFKNTFTRSRNFS